ncbi:MAG: thiol reductant ABC exporter subunit CydC [Tetrasphaera sp.]
MSDLPDLRILRLTRPLVLAGVIGGLALASGVALTATSGWLIVRASERPVILTLLAAIVAVRAFGMARPALRYWERQLTHDAALRDLAGRRTSTYAALIPLTPARLGRRGRADLLTGVVDDLDDVVGAQIRVTVPGLSAIVAWALTTLVTGLIDIRTGGILLALGVAVTAICAISYRLELFGNAEIGQARADITRLAALITIQGEEIRAVNGTAEVLAQAAAAHDDLRRRVLHQARGRALAAAGIMLAVGLATLAVTLLLGNDPTTHAPPVAALLVLAPVAAADALTPLAEAARALARSRGSADRLRRVLAQDPAVAAPQSTAITPSLDTGAHTPTRQAPHLRLTGISARWAPDRPLALAPTDLDLPPGTHLTIAGPNGGGKSTILAVLARQLDPEDGRYRIDADDALALPLRRARARFAVVDDGPHVFASTLRENLRFASGGMAGDDAIRDALGQAGLGPWLAALPDGLDTRLGTGGRGLSGGEQARLALARALLSQRPVILLDEPVAHLDSATAREVVADLIAGSRGRTLVMVSHRKDGRDGFGATLWLAAPDTSTPAHNPSADTAP